MKNWLAVLLLAASLTGLQAGGKNANAAKSSGDDMPPPQWITGDVFVKDDVLFYRLDKPVKGNPLKDVVLLGTTKETADVLMAPLFKAAEKHLTVRLYGWLLPCDQKIPGKTMPLPNVQFIIWKIHLPSDLDVLPPKDRVTIPPKGN